MPEKLAEVKSIIRKRILGMPEVSSISYDEEEGEVVITVTSEEARERVREEIPDVIGGYRTEIKIMPKQELLYPRKAKHRPVPGGVSIAHYMLTAGTNVMGATDQYEAPVLLSNAHVGTPILITGDYGSKGDRWEQPGPSDQAFGEEDFKCGELQDWVETRDNMTYSDAAIATPTVGVADYVLGEQSEEERWEVTEAVKAEKGLEVKKAGRTSGVTSGKITSTKADVPAQDHEGNTLWIALDQVLIDMKAIPGDSGSIIVSQEDESKAVALLWGSAEGKSSATPMGYVMQDLGIRFPETPEPPETHPPITPPPPRKGPKYKLLGGVGMVGLAAFSMFNTGVTGRDPFRW